MGNKVHNKIVMGEHWDLENIQQCEKSGITYTLIKMEALDEHGVRNTNIKTQWWIVRTKKEAPLCIGYDEGDMKFVFSCVGIGVSIVEAVGDACVESFKHKAVGNILRMKAKAKAEGIDFEKMRKMIADCKAKGMSEDEVKRYFEEHKDEVSCPKDSSELDAYTRDLDEKMRRYGFDLDKLERKMQELLDSGMAPEDVEKYMHEHMMDFKKPAASGRSDW